MKRFILLPALTIFALSACEMQAPPLASAPQQQNPILPVASPARVSDSFSTTTTVVEGNTTRTVTESGSVSVDARGLLGAMFGGAAAPTANSARDYAGRWRAATEDNRECTVNLLSPRTPNAPAIAQTQGCSGDLFWVTRWSLRGSELVLTDTSGSRRLSVRPSGVNRLDGDITMWR
jgi:ABC-type Fe3+-hydroxamate transport system substrate-binding protein